MRSFTCGATFKSFQSLADRSLKCAVITPPLTTEERSAIMEIQDVAVKISVHFDDAQVRDHLEIEAAASVKSKSKHLYDVIFVLYKQTFAAVPEEERPSYESFREDWMDKIIQGMKNKLTS